ncbi:MAG TPA: TonB-dependent receptor [Acidobacteriaceae bacterium]|jgi:hypothetical protein|nr:TonB-dependent receptor [Acidobacteriaceae bacterium]
MVRSGARFCLKLAEVLCVLAFASWTATAQNATGAIAGVAKDPSGAALVGVKVVASSPALIEKERTVKTDEHGQYKIEDLRPGTYSVTFTLSGFNTFKRDGLELNSGVTLPVDAEMAVGSVDETVTVSAASPVVDVQNANSESVLTEHVLETVPQAGGIPAYTEVTLGAMNTGAPDVGGNKGEELDSILIHDSRPNDGDELLDGMSWSSGQSTGGLGQRSFVINKVSVQETTVSTGPGGADAGHPGANVNIVPKEGGDQFHAAFNGTGATRAWQSTNLSPALIARGLTSGQNIRHIYDFGLGLGGPIVHEKLWFWAGFGDWAALNNAPGDYFNATQNTLFYTPDLKRPAYTNIWNYAYDIRLDWQATKKNKFSLYQGFQDFCICFENVDSSNEAPEATENNWNRASFLTQASWMSEVTSRLLLRVGYTAALAPGRVNAKAPGVTSTDVPITLQNTGYAYHAQGGLSGTIYGKPVYNEMNGIATMAYITGSHALKVGFTWQWNNQNYRENPNIVPGIGPVAYLFNQHAGAAEPVPVQITEYAAPLHFTSRSWVDALYAQDQWTIRHLTLNLGLRYDWERGYAPAQTEPATTFTPQHDFPAVRSIPDWNDIEPRVGASYDVFGNGKTAVKAAFGRYVLGDYTTTTVANTPADAIVTSATRTWNDSNGDYVTDCDLTSTAANGECGALSNNGFGGVSTNTRYDPAILSGWQVRPYNWQLDAQIQQQLIPSMALDAGFYRTWYRNFSVTENTAVPSSEYGTYCITSPTDSRVSALKGQQICGFHDVNPAYYGKVQSLVTKASNFGGQSEVFTGFDVGINWRFGRGGLLFGGVSLGQTTDDDCNIVDKYPNVTATMTTILGTITSNTNTPTQFCHVTLSWGNQSQVKFAGSYPIPIRRWHMNGIQAAFTYQNVSGYPYNTSYVANNTQIAQSLGRNIAACGTTNPCTTTVTLTNALYSPFTQTEARLNQTDIRFAKVFHAKRVSIKTDFDVYNAFNANTIITENSTYNASNSYLRPTSILGPRLFKIGTHVNF